MKIAQRAFQVFLTAACLAAVNIVWAQEKPNVLLIINDQHNGSVMTQRGYPYIDTPAIDRLAESGVTFTRAYTPYPICKAMRYSLMTGMMVSQVCPDCTGKFQNVTSRKSLGMRMKEAGYETAYFGKWHVGQTGLNDVADWHGFDTYMDHSSSKGGDTYTRDNVIAWLREEREEPFFLVASFMNPHDSAELGRLISGFTESVTFKDKPIDWQGVDVEAEAPPLPANFGVMENEPEGFTIRRPQGPDDRYWSSHPTAEWTETDWRRYMWGYDRLVEMMDAHVGLVLDELESQGLMDNTLVIFTSDHGDGHASHRWNMKMSFYEEAVNIPFIVTWPGRTRAGVIDRETLISNSLDINSTLLAVAGVKAPEHFRGLDLMPLVLEQPAGSVFEPRDFVVTEMLQVDLVGRMVAGPDYKYILFDGGQNPEVLIDLVNDPGELKPVTNDPAYREKLIMARQALRDWVRETGDPFNIDSMPRKLPGAEPAVAQEGRHGEILTITEVNWSSYPKIQLERATVEFQKNWVRDQKSRNGYTIRESDLERIRSDMADLLDEVLGQELTKECAYTLVDQGGPGVMRFTPRIVNLNIYAPDRVRNHIGYTLSDSQGSMTLELEIHDSESGALLATSRHHQVDPYKGYMEWTTSGTNRRSARLMLKRWASGLCERLDEVRAGSK